MISFSSEKRMIQLTHSHGNVGKTAEYDNLRKMLKLFILCHGQAKVKRRFNITSNITVENLYTDILIA